MTDDLPISVIDRAHPATAHLPSPWRFKEELYLFRDFSADARVLLGVEMGSVLTANPAGNGSSAPPVAWCIERGPLRTFYTVLGHFVTAYEDGMYMRHLLGGVEWGAGMRRGRPEAERGARPTWRPTARRELRVNKCEDGLNAWVRQHTIEPSVQLMNKSSLLG